MSYGTHKGRIMIKKKLINPITCSVRGSQNQKKKLYIEVATTS